MLFISETLVLSFTVVFVVLSLCHQCMGDDDDRIEKWIHFKEKYSKDYSEDEDKVRQEVFFTRLEKISQHNALYERGVKSYKMAVNKYSDLTNEEFKSKFKSRISKNHSKQPTRTHGHRGGGLFDFIWPKEHNVTFPPATFDLRKVLGDKMPPVRNQGTCGSCWAISPVASIEMLTALLTNKSIHYSVQQVTDCTYKVDKNSAGCEGGFPESALDFILKYGLNTESEYPTKNYFHPCRMRETRKTIIKGYRYLSANESQLLAAVAQGPIITEISASSETMLGYSSGIIDDISCSDDIDHVAVIIGYENDSWILQNSWGTDWGEGGYFRIKRGVHMCGVALDSIQLLTSSAPTTGHFVSRAATANLSMFSLFVFIVINWRCF